MKDSSKAIVTLVVIFVTVAITVTLGSRQLWLDSVSPEKFEEAWAMANNAMRTASAAVSMAQEAAAATAEAQRTGDAAQACCNEISDKLGRMWVQPPARR